MKVSKLVTAVMIGVSLSILLLSSARADELQELVSDAHRTIVRFTSDPDMDWFRENVTHAKGVLIIPQLVRAGFIFGGAGGSGVLLARDPENRMWSYPAFYTMGSASVGAQVGGNVAEVVLMIMTQKGMDSMLATSVKLGADVEVAAGPVGVGTKVATADILAFSRAKGFYGGAAVEGAVIATRDSWNEAYYGHPVRPLDILVKRGVKNPQADALRETVAKVAGGVWAPSSVASQQD